MGKRLEWMQSKAEIARRLESGECGGEYGEAILILGAAISALAAERWPGRRIDKPRFIQLLVDSQPDVATTVSGPLLVKALEQQGKLAEAQQLRLLAGISTMSVVLDYRVDITERKLIAAVQGLSLENVRDCSYAAIIYGELRSAYAHEFGPGRRVESYPMSFSNEKTISYLNRLDDQGKSERIMHIPIGVVSEIALNAAAYCDGSDEREEQVAIPQPWWISIKSSSA